MEGKNIIFEHRFAEGKADRIFDLADELVRLKVEAIVTSGGPASQAAKKATTIIPIVMAGAGDPVRLGLVESLARPGGNVTGFTTMTVDLADKRLESLKETVPKLSRVAVLWDPKNRGAEQAWKEGHRSAKELGLQLHSMAVSSADQFENAFKEAIKAHSTALAVTLSALTNTNQKRIADLAEKHRLPAIYPRADYVESGGLMSYSVDGTEPYRRAAAMVDKILKGTKPAEIPVEQPMKFELVINLKAAKTLVLTIPPMVLMRAQRVIR